MADKIVITEWNEKNQAEFDRMYGEALRYCQIIEFDLRTIYGIVVREGTAAVPRDTGEGSFWEINSYLKKDPRISRAMYQTLEEMRSIRNYLAHNLHMEYLQDGRDHLVYSATFVECYKKLAESCKKLEEGKNEVYILRESFERGRKFIPGEKPAGRGTPKNPRPQAAAKPELPAKDPAPQNPQSALNTLPAKTAPAENRASVGELSFAQTAQGLEVTGMGTCTATRVVIPAKHDGKKVKGVADGAFEGNRTLRELVIEKGVGRIGKNAFAKCASLGKITLPGVPVYLSDWAFADCGLLGDVYVISKSDVSATAFAGSSAKVYYYSKKKPAEPGNYWRYAGSTVAKWAAPAKSVPEKKNGAAAPGGGELSYAQAKKGLEVTGIGTFAKPCVVIPAKYAGKKVLGVADGAFSGNQTICELVVERGVGHIGKSAFAGCRSLKKISLPNVPVSMGEHAFSDCTSLGDVFVVSGVSKTAFAGSSAKIYYYSKKKPDGAGRFWHSDKGGDPVPW
ncbi:MAG: leucine-rich repeat domain-containing protein [Clostridia bacterium]|nr:leucine-rich repeat domain-containing protein [Clostridia bacterium]